MKTVKFNQIAAKSAPPPCLFEKMAAEAYQTFPGILNKVFFINSTDKKLYHPEQSPGKNALSFINHSRYGRQYLRTVFQINYTRGGRACFHKNTNRFFITVATNCKNWTPTSDREKSFFLLFNHELGHAIVPKGYTGSDILRENIADAFAVIRYFQRYGTEDPVIRDFLRFRQKNFTAKFSKDAANCSRFTMPVIEALMAQKNKIDFAKLSPAETIQYAHDVAIASAPYSKFLSWKNNMMAPASGLHFVRVDY